MTLISAASLDARFAVFCRRAMEGVGLTGIPYNMGEPVDMPHQDTPCPIFSGPIFQAGAARGG
jgi:hypothetical protein